MRYSKQELTPGVNASVQVVNKQINKIRKALETVTDVGDADLFILQLTVLRSVVRDLRKLHK
jgi:hypothetical protein